MQNLVAINPTKHFPYQMGRWGNLHRRHLNESQRQMVAARIANMKRGGDRKSDQSAYLRFDRISQSEAAIMLNVSRRAVQSAAKVLAKPRPKSLRRLSQRCSGLYDNSRQSRKLTRLWMKS